MLPLNEHEKIVAADEILLRRIPDYPEYTVYDHKICAKRPTSCAFRLRADESYLSVDRLAVLLARGKDALFSLNGYPEFGLARLFHNDFICNNITVTPEPKVDNAAHSKAEGVFSKKVSRELARCCSWVKQPGFGDRT